MVMSYWTVLSLTIISDYKGAPGRGQQTEGHHQSWGAGGKDWVLRFVICYYCSVLYDIWIAGRHIVPHVMSLAQDFTLHLLVWQVASRHSTLPVSLAGSTLPVSLAGSFSSLRCASIPEGGLSKLYDCTGISSRPYHSFDCVRQRYDCPDCGYGSGEISTTDPYLAWEHIRTLGNACDLTRGALCSPLYNVEHCAVHFITWSIVHFTSVFWRYSSCRSQVLLN